MPRLIEGLAGIAENYDVVLCDVWGVVHNGATALMPAVDALSRFRARGGAVVLLTNSPGPSRLVAELLDRLSAPRSSYDAIASSGDVTVSLLIERAGQSLFHIGAAAETGLFEEVAALTGRAPRQAPIESADFVLCTGFIDFWRETPQDYDERLKRILNRRLDFICANPDLVVEVDGALAYCAGAIAERYQRLGGRVIQAGKPFAPIYHRALALAGQARGEAAAASRVLAIGDAMGTDIKGAAAQGFDSILVTSGIHRQDLHPEAKGEAQADPECTSLDAEALRQFVATAGCRPTAAMTALRW